MSDSQDSPAIPAIPSTEAYSPGWKFGWSFPVTGPSWTDVPCSVQLHASSHDSEMTGEATLHFTYWQVAVARFPVTHNKNWLKVMGNTYKLS